MTDEHPNGPHANGRSPDGEPGGDPGHVTIDMPLGVSLRCPAGATVRTYGVSEPVMAHHEISGLGPFVAAVTVERSRMPGPLMLNAALGDAVDHENREDLRKESFGSVTVEGSVQAVAEVVRFAHDTLGDVVARIICAEVDDGHTATLQLHCPAALDDLHRDAQADLVRGLRMQR
jgi:hypothetical protein